jgi:nucleoside-diphosphate-sugar epimerase
VRVLVVGATGVLGRALVPALEGAGHKVRGIARHPTCTEVLQADLLRDDLAPLVEDCDAVIHAATSIPRDPSAPGAWDLNTQLRNEGTRRLLAATGSRRYAQQSIVMAYADGGDRWLDESWPFDSSPARAQIVDPVREMESLVRASEADWVILRGGQFTPLRLSPIACDGQYFISPIHPADYAEAIAAALERARSQSTFNITADPLRYADYAAPLNGPRAPDRPCPPSHRCTSALAHSLLAWQPKHPILH